MGDNRPIGIFDSGVGGLTVVKSLLEKLPQESFIYFGDTAHVPYGSKSEQELMRYAREIIAFLLDQDVKAIIVACGTHSSITLPRISEQYDIPLLGVVKAAASCAVKTTHNGKIGVVATRATVNSRAYTGEIQRLDSSLKVYETACPQFVPLVEAGKLEEEETREAVSEYLQPLLDLGIDSLVLGCTHYPFLTKVISDFTGEGIEVIDPSCKTVDQAIDIFSRQDLFNQQDQACFRKFYVSGNDESFYNVGRLLIGDTIKEVHKVRISKA
ncbi:MAG: glutamate racemase [Syntrophomonadaceae bacterium]|nr:glutamate racemase [Syntrophomonadaceae bacterium]MDD4563239.1 glutamate racemase [Syntrophomonadaceae bacterium]